MMPYVSIGDLFVISLIGTLLAGVAAIIMSRARSSNAVSQAILIGASSIGLIACTLFFVDASSNGASAIPLPGINLVVTGLSSFFLAIVYLGLLLTSIYAIGYLPKYRHAYSLPLLNLVASFFALGMQVTLMAPTVFWFLVGWEVMSTAAYFLVIADRSDESLRAGFLYFVMTQVGFACIMSGFLILAHGDPFISWPQLSSDALFISSHARALAFVLLLIGFGSKAGLVPLHIWLPAAHPQAPSHSSALLSGVMLKVALYGFILTLSLFQMVPLWSSLLVLVLGLLSGFFGALFAVVDVDAKRILAWSSIENMGLIFSALGIFLLLNELPQSEVIVSLKSGAVLFVGLHALNHFLFKSGLFMAAGAMISETHTRNIDELGGLAQKWPLFSGVFLILSLAAAALPPMGSFYGEWVYVQTLAAGIAKLPLVWAIGSAVSLSFVALICGLTLFAFVKTFSVIFLGRARSRHAESVGSLSHWLVVPPLIAAVLSVLSGLIAPQLIINALSPGNPVYLADSIIIVPDAAINPWLVAMLMLLVSLVLMVFHSSFQNMRRIRYTETWDCGQPLTKRMQYTATGFASPIRFFFRTVLLSQKEVHVMPVSPLNPWITKKRMEWGVSSVWERTFYAPLVSGVLFASVWVKRLQSGVMQLYLLFVMIALVACLFFAI